MSSNDRYELAGHVRDECVRAALTAYESASISGLCAEGAFEAAVGAMRMLDIESVIDRRPRAAEGKEGPGLD